MEIMVDIFLVNVIDFCFVNVGKFWIKGGVIVGCMVEKFVVNV